MDKIDTLDQGILALRSRKRQSGFIVTIYPPLASVTAKAHLAWSPHEY
ncbi:hypothetical protein [Shewanella xiamenensis]|nr:hypothetical protein [Shewanella xiamenensis]